MLIEFAIIKSRIILCRNISIEFDIILPFYYIASAKKNDYTDKICIISYYTVAIKFYITAHPGAALLRVPTSGDAPARAPGGCVFEQRLGVGGRNARKSEYR